MSNPRSRAGDPTLINKLTRAKMAQCGLLCFDLLIPLFLDGDIKELEQASLPGWWWILAVAMHLLLTFCLISYFRTAEKYLCLHRPSARIKTLSGAQRKTEMRTRNQLTTIVGWLSVAVLVAVSALPHLLTPDGPLVLFGAGLIVFKTTTLVTSMQVLFFYVGWLDIRHAQAEWKELKLTDFPKLTFKQYALLYDGTDESLEE